MYPSFLCSRLPLVPALPHFPARAHALTHSRSHALTHSRSHAPTHSRSHTLTHSRPALSHSRSHAPALERTNTQDQLTYVLSRGLTLVHVRLSRAHAELGHEGKCWDLACPRRAWARGEMSGSDMPTQRPDPQRLGARLPRRAACDCAAEVTTCATHCSAVLRPFSASRGG